MKVAFVHYFSEELKEFSIVLLKKESLIKNYFEDRAYGVEIQELYVGLIAVAPQFESFFKVRKPKYTKGEINFLEYDVKLDYKTLINSSVEEALRFTLNAITEAFPMLTKICSKLDFDLTAFKNDFEILVSDESIQVEKQSLFNEESQIRASQLTTEVSQSTKSSEDQIAELNKFIAQNKFEEDKKIPYPGLSDRELKKQLTELVNLSAIDFVKVVENEPLPGKFYQVIKEGLDRINVYKYGLDSEEQDRIALYFEEMMDIVQLPDSGGHLNIWRYGIDFNALS